MDAIEAEKAAAAGRIEPFQVDSDAPQLAWGGGPGTGTSSSYLPSGTTSAHFTPTTPAQVDTSASSASRRRDAFAVAAAGGLAVAEDPNRRMSRRRPPPGSKAALRQQELDAQVRTIEREVSLLQSQRSQIRPQRRPSGGRPAPRSLSGQTAVSTTAAAVGVGGSDPDGNLQGQIEALRLQVERLQAERERYMWEPPPGYENEEEGFEEDELLVEDDGQHSPTHSSGNRLETSAMP